MVRASTKSGYYVLDLNVVEQLREQLRRQQTELGDLLRQVPSDSELLGAHRERQRELNMAISRTERDLREAVLAVEAAETYGASETSAAPQAKAA